MKKLMHLSLLAMGCLGLFGCPYESQVPISKPSIPVDTRFLGKWNSKDEVYNTYTVSKASESVYHIVQQNISSTAHFRGFLSEVKGSLFMNLYSDSTRTYYIYKVKLDPSAVKLTLLPLSESLPDHFGSMDGLRNYLEKNMAFQSFYNEEDKAEFEKADPGRPTASN